MTKIVVRRRSLLSSALRWS